MGVEQAVARASRGNGGRWNPRWRKQRVRMSTRRRADRPWLDYLDDEHVLPVQLFEPRRAEVFLPQRELCAAVIWRAIGDSKYRGCRRDHVRFVIEAQAWLADRTSDHPWSFLWCCQQLGINVRQGVLLQ